MWCDPEAEPYLVAQLEQALGCPVVLANQTAPAPSYPYVSYTITTPVHHVGGTYALRDGVYVQQMLQTWSVTAHHGDCRQCQQLGMRLYDFFARGGRQALFARNIAVQNLSDLTQRDNYLTIQYEYRCGLDVTLRVLHQLETDETQIARMEICGTSIERRTQKNGII